MTGLGSVWSLPLSVPLPLCVMILFPRPIEIDHIDLPTCLARRPSPRVTPSNTITGPRQVISKLRQLSSVAWPGLGGSTELDPFAIVKSLKTPSAHSSHFRDTDLREVEPPIHAVD